MKNDILGDQLSWGDGRRGKAEWLRGLEPQELIIDER